MRMKRKITICKKIFLDIVKMKVWYKVYKKRERNQVILVISGKRKENNI